MKIFKIILIVIVAIVALAVVAYAYYGGFKTITFKEEEQGGEIVVYENVTGDYSQSPEVQNKIYNALLNDYKVETTKGFGIYYDNPKEVEKSKLRAEVGCIVEGLDSKTIAKLAEKYNVKTLPKRSYVVTEFSFKGKLSVFVGIMKVYPAMEKYCQEHEISNAPITEIYDVANKKIIYRKEISTKTTMESTITPCLWFDSQAEEATKFYTSVFKNGKIETIVPYPEGGMAPAGSVMTVKFQLAGQSFIGLNGGPYFKFTPAISFFVGCENVKEFDELWEKLSEGGSTLMEPEAMPPFFEKFGWLQDKYGLSWQLGICGIPQYISPFLMFVGKQCGRAEEAINFYRSIFDSSSVESIVRHTKTPNEIEGSVLHASFTLNGQPFMASDSGWDHKFGFTEAVSFYVYCQTQAEIDKYWEALSAGGEKSQCGWLKDRFGISWQIVPASLEEMMSNSNPEKAKRVTEALLKMKKIDMDALQKAFE